jgi:hypothetical protein
MEQNTSLFKKMGVRAGASGAWNTNVVLFAMKLLSGI